MNHRKKKRILLARMPLYPWIPPGSSFYYIPADEGLIWFEQLMRRTYTEMQAQTGVSVHHMEVGYIEQFRFIVSEP